MSVMMTGIDAPPGAALSREKPVGARGFTLVEVLIVVVIVGILAAIAYPSYQNSVRKSRRADAHAAISALQQAEERLRGNCRFYGQTIAAADVCGADAANTSVRGSGTSPEGFYSVTIAAGTATGNAYVIQADPQGPQAADSACDPIVLTVSPAFPNGQKSPADCW